MLCGLGPLMVGKPVNALVTMSVCRKQQTSSVKIIVCHILEFIGLILMKIYPLMGSL